MATTGPAPRPDYLEALRARGLEWIEAHGGVVALHAEAEAAYLARLAAAGEADPADRATVDTEDGPDGIHPVTVDGRVIGLVSATPLRIRYGIPDFDPDDEIRPGHFYAVNYLAHFDEELAPVVHLDVYHSHHAAVRGVVQCDDDERADRARA